MSALLELRSLFGTAGGNIRGVYGGVSWARGPKLDKM